MSYNLPAQATNPSDSHLINQVGNKPVTASSNTFTLRATKRIESLDIEYQEYQHQHTGAQHIHLAADNNENVFLVALRTVPTDSTGVAHILEHTSLCGSEKYPVRDPFFMMIRRSLNTFMNAFTSSDWTAYPFASQSRKDFDNLLQVYLDAVFFARLDPLDFAQEGHRVEFENPADSSSPLVYKGVVFNEMKGAMSSISSQLWQAVGEALFPDTTYRFNSGGDPAVIPDLSYAQLIAFYKKHYHPDNAVFMTYGNIAASEHQQKIEQLALSRFKHQNKTIAVELQSPLPQPRRDTKPYPLAEDEAAESNCHRVMAWVLDDIRDPMSVMSAHLLSSILLEDSASLLQQALETSPLGRAPSP
ncbi:MAG: insulinase family protein, partial [Gammaproteobacteria bacterium]|nr:insulinase family protein [Gammaproteobacteria bacterium]